MGGVMVVVLCVTVVLVTVLLWSVTRPPMVASTGLPSLLRRGVYWWLGATIFFSLAALAWVLLRGPLGLPRHDWYRYVPLALGLVPLLVVNPLWLWRTAWVRGALAAARGPLCTHCAYELTGLQPVGICPECGKAYDTAADAELWASIAKPPGDRKQQS